ncbi:hypothetical protein OOZ54_12960 [Rhodopseudomonas palustris]|uniref:glycoside hydrolase family 19 protein n=1 Tax=Rhodopseudomonas palustris TaxID=1076 RepID=UPI0022F07F13|nr:hypothetical protein [Rhodopseudomonas palustris]WBU27605.1 hypothetical protein OOZ54_12960 [Rhodopseudomonas palustris]
MTETGGLQVLSESGAYSAKGIMKIFGIGKHSARISAAEAARIAALPVAQRGPVLFNRAYGVGNPTKMREFDNTGPNDGWLYRGGGMMQCTGKSNYRKMAQKTGLPLVEHPELLHSPGSAFTAAYLEWGGDPRCNAAADRDDVKGARRAINGGDNGLDRCIAFLAKAKKVLANYGGATPLGVLADPAVNEVDESVDPELQDVQIRLKAMNYNPGRTEGEWGGLTAGAISGFINDRRSDIPAPTSAEAFSAVRERLVLEIEAAEAEGFARPVAAGRASADPEVVAEVAPEVVPAKRSALAAAWGALATFFAGLWQTVSAPVMKAWDFFLGHKDDIPEVDSGTVSAVTGYLGSIPPAVWIFAAAALLTAIWLLSRQSANAITQSVKTGARA